MRRLQERLEGARGAERKKHMSQRLPSLPSWLLPSIPHSWLLLLLPSDLRRSCPTDPCSAFSVSAGWSSALMLNDVEPCTPMLAISSHSIVQFFRDSLELRPARHFDNTDLRTASLTASLVYPLGGCIFSCLLGILGNAKSARVASGGW